MRATIWILLALAPLSLASIATAADANIVYLHDNPFHILPESMIVNAGDTVQLTALNSGSVTHDLYVCGDVGLAGPPESCGHLLGFTKELAMNETAPVTFTAPAAGS